MILNTSETRSKRRLEFRGQRPGTRAFAGCAVNGWKNEIERKARMQIFQDVELFTRDGRFVAKVQTPPFEPRYEVLIWGSRFFQWNEQAGKYLEVSAYMIP